MVGVHSDGTQGVRLSDVFRPEGTCIFEGRPTKQGVIQRLLASLAEADAIPRSEVIPLATALMARERMGTTALGKGCALPHLRAKNVAGVVGAIGLIPGGTDFDSLDGAPTHVVFLVLAQFDEREQHLEVMGRLSSLIHDKTTQFFLGSRPSPASVHEFLVDRDAR